MPSALKAVSRISEMKLLAKIPLKKSAGVLCA